MRKKKMINDEMSWRLNKSPILYYKKEGIRPVYDNSFNHSVTWTPSCLADIMCRNQLSGLTRLKTPLYWKIASHEMLVYKTAGKAGFAISANPQAMHAMFLQSINSHT